MMTCGYIESAQTSWLIFGTEYFENPGFETRGKAITELATDLYYKYQDEIQNLTSLKLNNGCCDFQIKNHPESIFCSVCGTILDKGSFDPDGFMSYVTGLHKADCNDYGAQSEVNDRDLVWWPWLNIAELSKNSTDNTIYIVENAEKVLLAALLDNKPELIQEESIRKEYSVRFDWNEFKQNIQVDYDFGRAAWTSPPRRPASS